jgi:hypothetical protein
MHLEQSPPVGCDSPSPAAGGRNRENPAPLPDAFKLQTCGANSCRPLACTYRCPLPRMVCILIPAGLHIPVFGPGML